MNSNISQLGIEKDDDKATLNADKRLGDLSSQSVMIKNGWIINVLSANDPKYKNQCGMNKTWFGYTYGYPVGSVKTTFLGNGKAVLNYGNCYYKGQVKVLLNKKQISSANGNVINKEVTFNYSKGDTLIIKEVNVAIIKLNSLEILK